jgi:hypothetical protein
MSFSAFPQQQQIVKLLQRSLDRGRLAHGYLFTGGSLEVPGRARLGGGLLRRLRVLPQDRR